MVAARAVANLAAGGISVGTYPRPEMSTAHLPRHCVLTALPSHGPLFQAGPLAPCALRLCLRTRGTQAAHSAPEPRQALPTSPPPPSPPSHPAPPCIPLLRCV